MLKMSMLKKTILIIIVVACFLMLPLVIPDGWLSLVMEVLILALAATGLNLMLGYAGMISFGAAGLYAVGAYTTALILINTKLPFALAFVAGPIFTVVIAIVIGWFCVRLTNVYFALLTLAFAQIIYTILFGWYSVTHGDNGIVDIPIPDILKSVDYYYYFIFIIVAICIVAMWTIIKSPFGKTLQAIRENPQRAASIGVNVRLYQLSTFVMSGFFLGIAGSLFCCFNRNVFPNYAHWSKSTEMLVVCVIGGVSNFFGPVAGSVIYLFLDKIITSYTQHWPLVLGIIIILLVLFLPGGIMGFLGEKMALREGREATEQNDVSR
jgi:branched-chain amino acid transport system permease protein